MVATPVERRSVVTSRSRTEQQVHPNGFVAGYPVFAPSEPDPYEVTDKAATPDHHLYRHYFKEGNGDYRTIDGSYYQHQDTGQSGVWQHKPDQDVERELALELQKLYVRQPRKGFPDREIHKFAHSNATKSVFTYNRVALNVPSEQRPETKHYIGFTNSVLDTRTGEILPYSREMFLTNQIQSEYTPGQDCPKDFLDYVKLCFGEDQLNLVRAIIRYFVDPSLPYGHFVHLIGESGSGKGVFIRFVGSLHGKFYKALSEFGVLSTPEGRHQNLTGTRVVAFPDVPQALANLAAFYELVDNGALSGRALYSSNAPTREWNVRFLVGSVGSIQFENSAKGWDRRCVPLATLPRSGDTDESIAGRLEACKAQVISWAMGMSQEDVMQELKHPTSSNHEELKDIQAITSSSVSAYVDTCLSPDTGSQRGISKTVKYAEYRAFCEASGLKAKSSNQFYKDMKTILGTDFEIERVRTTTGNDPSMFRGFTNVHPDLFETLPDTGKVICQTDRLSEGGLSLFREAKQLKQQPAPEPTHESTPKPVSDSDPDEFFVGAAIETQKVPSEEWRNGWEIQRFENGKVWAWPTLEKRKEKLFPFRRDQIRLCPGQPSEEIRGAIEMIEDAYNGNETDAMLEILKAWGMDEASKRQVMDGLPKNVAIALREAANVQGSLDLGVARQPMAGSYT